MGGRHWSLRRAHSDREGSFASHVNTNKSQHKICCYYIAAVSDDGYHPNVRYGANKIILYDTAIRLWTQETISDPCRRKRVYVLSVQKSVKCLRKLTPNSYCWTSVEVGLNPGRFQFLNIPFDTFIYVHTMRKKFQKPMPAVSYFFCVCLKTCIQFFIQRAIYYFICFNSTHSSFFYIIFLNMGIFFSLMKIAVSIEI